jgi:hypothetical protein
MSILSISTIMNRLQLTFSILNMRFMRICPVYVLLLKWSKISIVRRLRKMALKLRSTSILKQEMANHQVMQDRIQLLSSKWFQQHLGNRCIGILRPLRCGQLKCISDKVMHTCTTGWPTALWKCSPKIHKQESTLEQSQWTSLIFIKTTLNK